MNDNWSTYWFVVDDEDSDIDGEEFFTELQNATRADHIKYAREVFPGVKLKCYGKVSAIEAEMIGLDTY